MEWLFGHKKTPDEMLRENQRLLKKSMREMDREKAKLQKQEQAVMLDIKKAAKAQQYVCILTESSLSSPHHHHSSNPRCLFSSYDVNWT